MQLARFHLFALAVVLVGRTAARRGLGLALVALGGGAALLAYEVVVEDEFVAVRDQQVGRRLLHAHADHPLRILAQLGDERRKVRVARHDDEGVHVRLRVAQVERVHDHADVRRILAGLAHVGDFDQFEVRFMHRRLEALVAIPVAIGFLDHDAALEQQAFEDGLDVELLVIRIAHAERDVFEVAEHRHADIV
ncbi:hypothetical protein ASC93_06640 [Massilia sp. Root335]|nr:hypothetical protein ASC93_06640 [Massilia sp. Root335]